MYEKQITDLVKRIMESEELYPSLVNEALILYKKISKDMTIFKKSMQPNQANRKGIYLENDHETNEKGHEIMMDYQKSLARIENIFLDKIKMIDPFFKISLIKSVVAFLLTDTKKNDYKKIKDIRCIDDEVVIIDEDQIYVEERCYNEVLNLEDSSIKTEAAITTFDDNGNHKGPYSLYSKVYDDVLNDINSMLKELSIDQELVSGKDLDLSAGDFYYKDEKDDIRIYFDTCMMNFLMGIKKFNMIIAYNKTGNVDFYKVRDWKAEKVDKISGEVNRSNMSVLKPLAFNNKKLWKEKRVDDTPLLIIENLIDEYRANPFDYEKLLKAYGGLFENREENDYQWEDFNLYRLKFITAEKITQLGVPYIKAKLFARVVFNTIQEYKKQVINAIEGYTRFPEQSLPEKIKTIKIPVVNS